jgi:hypothetical protein
MDLSRLLPIPPGTDKPTPYEVFGLAAGIADQQRINAAVTQTIRQLKSQQAESDPAAWQQAARMVQQARGILNDPVLKAALDAEMNAVSDPLAGLLPSGDPCAPAEIAIAAAALGQEQSGAAQPKSTAVPRIDPLADPTKLRSTVRRRRRPQSSLRRWLLGLLTGGLLAASASVAYVVLIKPGSNISQQPPIAQTTGRPREIDSAVVERTVREPVVIEPAVSEPAVMEPVVSEPVMVESASMQPSDQESIPLLPESDQQRELERVADLIRAADWPQMQSAAESLLEKPLSAANKIAVRDLFAVAQLAVYYRGGIERAVAALQPGNDFAVTDSLRVIVVATADNSLTLRYNQQTRSLMFDEFPFSLAHKLASFQIPDGPTRTAAMAVYQSIAPRTTAAYRSQAIDWLRAIDAEIEAGDPNRIARTLESLYPATNHDR